MFYEIPISSQQYKKGLYDFFYRDVTAFHEVSLRPPTPTPPPPTPPCFLSHNITKNAETHTPYMHYVIIEQPLGVTIM